MEKTGSKEIQVAYELAEMMVLIANDHEPACEDDCCRLIYGVVRDCAYKIRKTAGEEMLCES